jgi:uncharacterized sporulation protein YeaH/YhbH (DUF444 family)
MTQRIDEDYQDFEDVYSGKIRKELGKYFSNGTIWKFKPNGKMMRVSVPKINLPFFTFGKDKDGVGRGPGDPGDVIDRDPIDGEGNVAGEEEAEGIYVDIPLEEVLKFMKEELNLPNMKPKPNEVFEEVKLRYNDISRQGPESLRHNRRMMLQALKRLCASGEINKLHMIPGYKDKMRLITPINSDRRYRQYREIKLPSSNAVIFFARDGSGSMDQNKCDIVSDMCWWIDLWIRSFYKRTERVYVWHDTRAHEVDEKKFYNYRYGGGTKCSSALKLISNQFDMRFPPDKWNIYVFYFTDGENWGDDNNTFIKTIEESFSEDIVNLIGITQVLAYDEPGSLRQFVEDNLDVPNLRTANIGFTDTDPSASASPYMRYSSTIDEAERNKQLTKAIKSLLGNNQEVKK